MAEEVAEEDDEVVDDDDDGVADEDAEVADEDDKVADEEVERGEVVVELALEPLVLVGLRMGVGTLVWLGPGTGMPLGYESVKMSSCAPSRKL